MLNEIDAALSAALGAVVADGVRLRFDAPRAQWSEETDLGPIIGVFLYRIREDLAGRLAGWTEERDERGRVVARQAPVRRFQLSYLLTAWARDIVREHLLLSTCLAALAVRDVLAPVPVGQGSLLAADEPISVTIANAEVPGASPEVWHGLAIPPRGAIDLVVTAALLPVTTTDLARHPSAVDLGVDPGGVPVPVEPAPRLGPPDKRVREQS